MSTDAGFNWSMGSRVPSDGPSLDPSPSPSQQLEAGALFDDRYRVVAALGQGGMGTVYRARDEASGREVALKLLSKDLTPKAKERLRREGELTAALRHPGIVAIHSAGEADGVPYLAYELIEGGRTLADVLPSSSLRERVELLREVCGALGFAHRQGVVHRDVKADNVLIDSEGRPRVADFGLAWTQDATSLTRTGALVGTPTSMAPEQITADKGQVGAWTDVWALGVLLYHSLAGELPFNQRSFVALSAAICSVAPRPLQELNPEVSPDLERICLRALARAPADRYPDGQAMAEDLDNYLAARRVSASSLASRFRGVPARRRWAAAALVAAVLGCLGAWWTARDVDPDVTLRSAIRGLDQPGGVARLAALVDAPGASPEWLGQSLLILAEAEGLAPEERLRFAERAAALGHDVALAQAEIYQTLGRHSERASVLALVSERDPALRLEQAAAHLAAGELPEARVAAQSYLEQRPPSAAALRVLGLAFAQEGDEARALEVGVRAAKLVQEALPGALAHAEVLAALDLDPQPIYQAAARRWPRDPRVREAWAIYLLSVRHAPRAAAEVLSAAVQSARVARLSRWVRAVCRPQPAGGFEFVPAADRGWVVDCLLREGREQLGLALGQHDRRRRLQDPELEDRCARRARTAFEATLALDASSPHAAVAHVGLALLTGLEEESATAHLEAAARIDPGAPFVAVGLTRAWLLRADPRAREALQAARAPSRETATLRGWIELEHDPESAARLLEEAWLPLRDDAEVCALLIAAYTRLGHAQQVAELTERGRVLAGAREAEAAETLDRIGGSAMRAMDAKAALAALDSVLELDPLNHRALLERGVIGVSRGEGIEVGMTLVAAAVRREPAFLERLHRSLVSFSTSSTMFSGGNVLNRILDGLVLSDSWADRRLQAYAMAWVIETESREELPWAWNTLRKLDRILEDDPGDWAAHAYRGLVHLRMWHLAEAAEDFRFVTTIDPRNSLVTLYEALLLARQRKPLEEVVAAIDLAVSYGYDGHDSGGWSLAQYPELAAYVDAPEMSTYVHR